MLNLLLFWPFLVNLVNTQELNSNSLEYNNYGSDYNPNYYSVGAQFLDELKCPEHWIFYQQFCYKFIKSPLRPYTDARRLCQVCFIVLIIIYPFLYGTCFRLIQVIQVPQKDLPLI